MIITSHSPIITYHKPTQVQTFIQSLLIAITQEAIQKSNRTRYNPFIHMNKQSHSIHEILQAPQTHQYLQLSCFKQRPIRPLSRTKNFGQNEEPRTLIFQISSKTEFTCNLPLFPPSRIIKHHFQSSYMTP